jgi:hypothetical protein
LENLENNKNFFKLLNVGRNHKTVKGDKKGEYLTGIMYLAPSTMSGIANLCPKASEGCKKACLVFSGHAGRFSSINESRIRKTRVFINNRPHFLRVLVADIQRLVRRASRKGVEAAVRLNGTSDILWERVPVSVDGVDHPNIMAAFPDVWFYDYTKIPDRQHLPKNYDLTFSLAENNEQDALDALANGMNVAVVFDGKKGPLPSKWWGLPVVDGDDDDLRFLDPRKSIIGLKAKGTGRKDTSGFIKDPTGNARRPRKERNNVVSMQPLLKRPGRPRGRKPSVRRTAP